MSDETLHFTTDNTCLNLNKGIKINKNYFKTVNVNLKSNLKRTTKKIIFLNVVNNTNLKYMNVPSKVLLYVNNVNSGPFKEY